MLSQCLTIIGTQYGDEGKGKFTELIAKDFDIIVRYQGGDNAGHSIVIKDKRYSLRLIPSGIFYPKKTVIIGNGVVVNPETLLEEIKYLNENKISTAKLLISSRAHIIFNYHKIIDELNETIKGKKKIGTTKRGIGPCYSDKVNRVGIRFCDLFDIKSLEQKISAAIADKNIILKHFNYEKLDAKKIAKQYYEYGQKLKKLIADTDVIINKALNDKKRILFEGAQGEMLDLDFGTYPFVTSSNVISGAYNGSGLMFNKIHSVLGITKAYLSRVGSGPMPTEMDEKTANIIRTLGNEFGTVTKRPRRIGWIDLIALKHAVTLSGCTKLAISLLDVLDSQKNIYACIGYKYQNKKIQTVLPSAENYEQCKPIYKKFPGWNQPIKNIKKFNKLPINCQNYLKFISDYLKVKIAYISVGPERDQTIVLE